MAKIQEESLNWLILRQYLYCGQRYVAECSTYPKSDAVAQRAAARTLGPRRAESIFF